MKRRAPPRSRPSPRDTLSSDLALREGLAPREGDDRSTEISLENMRRVGTGERAKPLPRWPIYVVTSRRVPEAGAQAADHRGELCAAAPRAQARDRWSRHRGCRRGPAT